MKSIFNAADNAELIERIDHIDADTPALWGSMTAAQMMAHLQVGLNMALGNKPVVRTWLGRIGGMIGKKRVLNFVELDKYIPTFKEAEITDERIFEEEKAKLKALVKSALSIGPNGLVKYPHPYFSTFKNEEWSQLNWKHFDHHLRQFNSPPNPLKGEFCSLYLY